jgi:hypothetical protein
MNGENGDLLADSHNLLNKWNNSFYQLLDVYIASDVRQIEVLVHRAELLVPGLSALEVEIAITKLQKHISSSTDQIPEETIQVGGERYSLQSISLLILFGIRKNCLIDGRGLLLYKFTKRL